MTNPVRVEAAGAVYHFGISAVADTPIIRGRDDVESLEAIVTACLKRYSWVCYAYCWMTTHIHLVIRTGEPDLIRGAQWLNAVYAQSFNRRHGRRGRLWDGPYFANLAQTDAQMLEFERYTWLQPVRAKICDRAEDWARSSYRATVGLASPPAFLDVTSVHRQFSDDPLRARQRIREFVASAHDAQLPRP